MTEDSTTGEGMSLEAASLLLTHTHTHTPHTHTHKQKQKTKNKKHTCAIDQDAFEHAPPEACSECDKSSPNTRSALVEIGPARGMNEFKGVFNENKSLVFATQKHINATYTHTHTHTHTLTEREIERERAVLQSHTEGRELGRYCWCWLDCPCCRCMDLHMSRQKQARACLMRHARGMRRFCRALGTNLTAFERKPRYE